MDRVVTVLDEHTPERCRRDHGVMGPVVRLPHVLPDGEQCRCVKREDNRKLEYFFRRGKLVHCGYAEEEIDRQMYRTSHLTPCTECGKLVIDHPYIDDVLDNGDPWLHLMCDGSLAKT